MIEKIIALVKGDGIGPETMKCACDIVMQAARIDGIEIVYEETPMGWNAWDKYQDTLPEKSLKRAIEIGIIFFGAVGDPKFDNTIGAKHSEMKPEARALLALRDKMGLLLNFRPMIYRKELANFAGVRPERIPEQGVEQHFVRFLLEDSYFGNKNFVDKIPEDVKCMLGVKLKENITGEENIVTDIAYYRKETIEKYMRATFSYARNLNLPVISIDKANVMARYDFWRKIATRIGETEFPDVPLVYQLIDSAAAFLFTPEKLHGVIACGNEHGDILSDGAAAGVGSMGMMHSSAINPDTGAAMFESGAGTAPTLTGKNIANPIGRILAGAMMLRHIGAKEGGSIIESAVNKILKEGYRTLDIYSPADNEKKLLGTSEMGNLVLSYIQ